jgi:hypothetical protein
VINAPLLGEKSDAYLVLLALLLKLSLELGDLGLGLSRRQPV